MSLDLTTAGLKPRKRVGSMSNTCAPRYYLLITSCNVVYFVSVVLRPPINCTVRCCAGIGLELCLACQMQFVFQTSIRNLQSAWKSSSFSRGYLFCLLSEQRHVGVPIVCDNKEGGLSKHGASENVMKDALIQQQAAGKPSRWRGMNVISSCC